MSEIVDIVADVVYAPLDQRLNFASFYSPTRSSRMRRAWCSRGREAIATADPELAMRDAQPLTGIVRGSWVRNARTKRLHSDGDVAARNRRGGMFGSSMACDARRSDGGPARGVREVARSVALGVFDDADALTIGIASCGALRRAGSG